MNDPLVLVVDDNHADLRLLEEARRETGGVFRLEHALDTDAAAQRLRAAVAGLVPTPALVLLDLNLPRRSGLVLLQALKADAGLRRVPVVILTSSAAEAEVRAGWDAHANAFVTKPASFDGYVELLRAIEAFWLRWVRSAG